MRPAPGAEVLVSDVASAYDRRLVVGGERLVVHAPVHAREVGQEVERAGVATDDRVVEAHLDVRMRVERGDGRIEPLRVQVVEQQAHAHPTLGRLPERLEQQVADLVAMPDEVLHVERLFRGVGEQDARGERIAGVGKRMDARLAGIRSDAWRDRAAEPRPRRVGESGWSWSALPARAGSRSP